MLKDIFQKPSYIALVGALNFVTGLVLAVMTFELQHDPVFTGFVTLTFLNLGIGTYNLVSGLRGMKRLPRAAVIQPD